MNAVVDFFGRVLRAALKVLLLVAALVFALSVLLAAVVVVAVVSLWSLITGRKPAPLVMWGRVREQSQRYTQGVWPQRPGAAPAGEVVDVQATEVVDSTETARLTGGSESGGRWR